MRHCNDDALLALARGELPPSEAREVEDHAAECASCGRELAWLRTERSLFRAQPSKVQLPSHVWQGIERRIIIAREERREHRRRWLRGGAVAAAFAAAASLLVFVWGHGLPIGRHAATAPGSATGSEPPATETRPASEVLDEAEHEYRAAIDKLEGEYDRARAELDPETADRYDCQFSKLRTVLSTERAAAKDDLWARRRVLRAYSAYMRSMQAVVLEVHK